METDFLTDDILLTSFLLTQSISLVEVLEDKPHHFVFVLSNSVRCNELKKLYLNNAPAAARELFSQREMLISEIKNRNEI